MQCGEFCPEKNTAQKVMCRMIEAVLFSNQLKEATSGFSLVMCEFEEKQRSVFIDIPRENKKRML